MQYKAITGGRAESLAAAALERGKGIFRLAPAWVPRSFCVPGRRLRLHSDDYYALGGQRGGIDERWLASTTPADNGELTEANEGLSHIVVDDSGTEFVLLCDAVEALKDQLIGPSMWSQHKCWPMFSKFFDNKGALPHHVHYRQQHAALVGQMGKPEAYYFPKQLNNHGGDFPYTFFGLNPDTSKDQLRKCLEDFDKGDNGITNISRAYRLQLGTGWNVPPGVLHAPGSLCTYEPQKASDVYAMYQSLTGDQIVPPELLWKDTPKDRLGDIDYLIEVLDWEKNIDPDFAATNFMQPVPAGDIDQMMAEGYLENWICYKSAEFSAKELTVLPKRTVTITDSGPYGMIMLQGHGSFGSWPIESPASIRFGQLTHDEYFVSAQAAAEGVTITNPSETDPIVMLKHFGPNNPDMANLGI